MANVKANVRIKKQMEISIPPNVTMTKLIFSPRIEGGRLVFDIDFPDGGKVEHTPKSKKDTSHGYGST